MNVNVQDWLDEKYPISGTCQRDNDPENKGKRREDIIHLDKNRKAWDWVALKKVK